MRYLYLLCIFALLSCGQHKNAAEATAMPRAMTAAPAAEQDLGKMSASVAEGESSLTRESSPVVENLAAKRYIAMRHSLVVEAPAKHMQATFDAIVKHCEQLKCQMLSANYNRETPYNPPSASLSVRVPPQSVETFLTGLAKNGEVLQHHRESEDKTDAVIDAEARIKNLTAFRDNLRAMLSDKSAKFKDLIEVQRELVDTQSQLDTIQGVRKVLAQETELVAVNIELNAAQGITEQGFFSPVAQALKDAGRVMMESVAAVITFFVMLLPWVLFGIPIFMLMRRLWIRIRLKWQAQ